MIEQQRISIIIATYRRPRQLERCLCSLRAADRPTGDMEIIVVDDGGGLAALSPGLSEGLSVSVIQMAENVGQSRAQSAGVEASCGDLLAFLDDDAVVDRGWIRAIEGYFAAHPMINVVLGKVLPLDSRHLLARTKQQVYDRRHRLYTDHEFGASLLKQHHLTCAAGIHIADHVSGGNFAIRRSALKRAGGLVVEVRKGCDKIFSQRLLSAGEVIGYEQAMVIRHEHDTSYVRLFTNSYYEGHDLYIVLLRQQTGGKRFRLISRIVADTFRIPFSIGQFREILNATRWRVQGYLVFLIISYARLMGRMTALADFAPEREPE